LDSDFYAFTAAHVLLNAGNATLLAPSSGGKGGKLWPLPTCTARLQASGTRDDLEVAVLALQASELGPFQHHVFLTGAEIDQHDEPDDQGFGSFYFVLGYPASRIKVSWSRSHMDQE